jgi:hypothetical protein
MIVPNGVKQNSSEVFYILDPDTGGAETFSVPLSADGLAPATYWGTRTPLEWPTYDALKNMTTTEFMDYVNSLAAERGRAPPNSVAFKNSLLMDETMDFWTFVASLGLKELATPPLGKH